MKARILEFLGWVPSGVKSPGPSCCWWALRGGQDQHRSLGGRCPGARILPLQPGRDARRGGNQGHRRTYIGAMPGKFVQALKEVKVANPVIMLDEIDKIGASFPGRSGLGPAGGAGPGTEQEFPRPLPRFAGDLSKVLFICTANQLDTIPGPLLDRMETLRLSGYVAEENWRSARITCGRASWSGTGSVMINSRSMSPPSSTSSTPTVARRGAHPGEATGPHHAQVYRAHARRR